MWWLNGGSGRMDKIPGSVYYAAGFGGNYIVIFPDQHLVVVTRWLEPSKLGEFLDYVMEAVE
ncbi:MAG: hypothetical protein KFF73_13770 [Cyclobacteriaceae bacterium]|nr:hypothetical protein [Cyclobacteriaceae bacterium]